MKNQKILGSVIIIIIAGVLMWFFVNRAQKPTNGLTNNDSDLVVLQSDQQGRPTEQTRTSDPQCTENATEKIYYGDLQAGRILQVTLSCDQKQLTLTGVVNQVIDSTNSADFAVGSAPFIDSSGKSDPVNVSNDYNFDGYNDLYVLSQDSEGYMQDRANIFLYDTSTHKFKYNTELSKILNIDTDSVKKYVKEVVLLGSDGEPTTTSKYKTINYKWVNGHLLKVGN